ncbi:TDP-N-acetylfucosamine:lipid II N-acetylfucosaminyltransferase [Weeksellaceae bacterium KMM 9724]|uniref:TDP-N-acetylfucosamine:lipid II N-acetylfucosaminyltransferase n=1 Tax=Profundicola chukchiensis TaxID=2961959 RepID=UPI00243967D5|nr:TDP-N-acetylfucosamine:lipid II N-acetylfucosaminyltransferase [Profundicola chukchiensis]MDG4949867.1 TDP-N-acetylfucosamine:lipid II N-acetylfucosaminyltransferase [Profundicola chukchiensis]
MGKKIFESVPELENEYWVIADKAEIQHIHFEHRVFYPLKENSDDLYLKLNSYDLICIHFLNPRLYPLIKSRKIKTKILWIGWGGDYYWLINTHNRFNLYLPETTKFIYNSKWIAKLQPVLKQLKKVKGKMKLPTLNGVDYFAPVNKSEYDIILKNHPNFRPQFVDWNYGYINQDIINYYASLKRSGNKIMIGNSSTPTNNHLDVFKELEHVLENESLIVPLNYGNKTYAKNLKLTLSKQYNLNLEFMDDLMSLEDFNQLLLECKSLIIGSSRQQAMGTIITALYIGVNVFLFKSSLNYKFFNNLGLNFLSIEELKENPELINRELNSEQIEKNRKIINEIWSLERNANTIKELLHKI